MLKEYIQNLLLENEEEIQKLKNEMDELMGDIEVQQQQMVLLENAENADTNIFSPRSHGDEIHEKMVNAQMKVKKLNQETEHVREMIEALMKKKYEYESLMNEIKEREEYPLNEGKTTEEAQNAQPDTETETQTQESFQEILGKLYSKAEICLAFLNDKNRCKAELRSMKQMIKEYLNK